jgi:hypothetical protein
MVNNSTNLNRHSLKHKKGGQHRGRQVIIPTTHYSDSPFFRQPIIPTAHYSDNDKYLH